MNREPEQIDVDDGEELIQRVAAIDVAKASGMVCTRVPHPSRSGRRVTKVWEVKATTTAIMDLADMLATQDIERVVVESTSDYWRPFVYLLQARGLLVWLVNAHDVKNVPSRPKTDLLTELPSRSFLELSRRVWGLARFAARDQRRGCAAGPLAAGGATAGFA